MNRLIFLDCTLRDGGYYNSWNFDHDLVQDYLFAVNDAGVDVVELGFRTLNKKGFKGACAYSTQSFIQSLEIPKEIELCVMINASEIIDDGKYNEYKLNQLFPQDSIPSNISIIRIASHTFEFVEALHAVTFLNAKGFKVGFNLMQVSESESKELIHLAKEASKYPIDVLYFADSLGNMDSEKVQSVIDLFRSHWKGDLGIHAHDNMSMGLSNSLYSLKKGVTWVDSTVTGMGRGAGNVKTELLAIEISDLRNKKLNIKPLLSLITKKFKPLKEKYSWGTNPFYYLSGKNSVHPTYVQEMMTDSRYKQEDIISVIEHLGSKGGKKYSKNILGESRNYYSQSPKGKWSPVELFSDREVILIGSGPEAIVHKRAIEAYIVEKKPLVMALNAQSLIHNDLIDVRIACHPLRLLTDFEKLINLSKPLIAPVSSLPNNILDSEKILNILDYGLGVQNSKNLYEEKFCILSSPLVLSYSLAVASSGKAKRLLLAGFDGYSADDPRRMENDLIFQAHKETYFAVDLLAVTPTLYNIESTSIYAI
jgi:4-hydroxy 2-oxovalerate aldolase